MEGTLKMLPQLKAFRVAERSKERREKLSKSGWGVVREPTR